VSPNPGPLCRADLGKAPTASDDDLAIRSICDAERRHDAHSREPRSVGRASHVQDTPSDADEPGAATDAAVVEDRRRAVADLVASPLVSLAEDDRRAC
jgi:hypothetical protein